MLGILVFLEGKGEKILSTMPAQLQSLSKRKGDQQDGSLCKGVACPVSSIPGTHIKLKRGK